MNKFVKGHTINNGKHRSPATEFKKGHHYSRATEFSKENNSGEKNFNWKGGRYRIKIGYVVRLAPGHPRAYRNYVYEHILVAEKKLGRYLVKGECVHHINGIKDDNGEDNIIVFPSHGEHITNHCKYKKILQKPFPEPKKEGDRIKLMTNKKVYEVKKCIRCNKLYWAWGYRTKTVYCSHSCGTLGGRYGR